MSEDASSPHNKNKLRRFLPGALIVAVFVLGLASIFYALWRAEPVKKKWGGEPVCPEIAKARALEYLTRNKRLFPNTRYLTIIDYTRPSYERRLHLIDLKSHRAQSFLVAHGVNSGAIYARIFSNEPGSRKSSLGFFVTGAPYQGKHGDALPLEGLEQGVNDNAMKRAIVIHGAAYVSEESIQANDGCLGRSWGCPAVPDENATWIIDKIKGGSLVYVYGG
jgi:hypothetical protein